MRKFGDQRRAVGAGGTENVRMPHGEVQRPVASHGNAADAAGLPSGEGTILLIDGGDEFLNKKILVAVMPVQGIDVEAPAAFGHHHDEFNDLSLAHQIFPSLLPAMFTPAPVVFEQAVQVVQHWIPGGPGIVARRERDAIFYRVAQDGAGNSFAIDVSGRALCIPRPRENQASERRQTRTDELSPAQAGTAR